MKTHSHLIFAPVMLLGLLLLTGCKDSSSSESSGGGLAEVVSITAETTTETTTETTKRTTAPPEPEITTTAPPEESESTSPTTTTTTEPTVVGKWALDSMVDTGKIIYKDTSVRPAISFRLTLQLEFDKKGNVTRTHPLYGYSETGTWYYSNNEHTRVIAEFPYSVQFNPEEEPALYCFENGNLFIIGDAGEPDYNFVRVANFAEPDEMLVENGRAAFSVAGYWEGAWVTTSEAQYYDYFEGRLISGMKMQITLGGDCTYYEENRPQAAAVYTVQNLGGGILDLLLRQSADNRGSPGQLEGSISINNGYLIWRYTDDVIMVFRSVTATDFNRALFGEG